MTEMYNEQQVLERQVREWIAELKRLAGQIAAAKGQSCAIVMITPLDADYADVVPELIAEDAMRVLNCGWPEGFEVEVLNQVA
ncbi:hypothetical protein [Burkholderia ubonensis]|uniref:hypothetical protein n=1 Tax=Burkholderia ubonensis TaxID=101571 RepID=UPI000758811D|nr:hypothetical protein [Burkholderia ubonensis]KVW76239.1 hypothetical protein WK99_29390 [Burkholderia ubonensis]